MIYDQLPDEISTPSVLEETDQFIIKLASTPDEIKCALELRYKIFNLEQGKGLKTADRTGIDCDEFDPYCLHLIVMEKKNSRAVGTYRIHLGFVANREKGFYSTREYDLIEGFDEIAEMCMEVGRSCVAPEFRTGAAVALLWAGISELLKRTGLRYLLGCVSLETTRPVIAWGLYDYFEKANRFSKIFRAEPRSGFLLARPTEKELEDFYRLDEKITRYLPPLFKGYLRLGAKICGAPAIDHEFGTVDYLIIVDTTDLPERYARHFNCP